MSESVFTGEPVTIEEMANCRSHRVQIQEEYLEEGKKCYADDSFSIISFSMNIPGPIKQFPLASLAFDRGFEELKELLPANSIRKEDRTHAKTGSEGFLLINVPAEKAKETAIYLEDDHPLGRLFDIDVLDENGQHMARTGFGYSARKCLICGKDAKICARSRAHDVETMQRKIAEILHSYFRDSEADHFAACAIRALLYEVSVTPKPGLVDRNNSGSHRDMNYFTFLDSSAALSPWFREMYCCGFDHPDISDENLFLHLRYLGKQADQAMYTATHGVNTHKGLVFSMALVSGALGKLRYALLASDADKKTVSTEELIDQVKALGTCSLQDYEKGPDANGSTKPAGARAAAAAGYPMVTSLSLPTLEEWLNQGVSLNDAAAAALLSLISSSEDSNILHRGGKECALRRQKEALDLLSLLTPDALIQTLTDLDRSYIEENISPGGCADLLALTLLFHFLKEEKLIS